MTGGVSCWFAVTIWCPIDGQIGQRWLAQNSMLCASETDAVEHFEHLEYERGIMATVQPMPLLSLMGEPNPPPLSTTRAL